MRLALVALLACVPVIAWAHGEYAWIGEQKLTDPVTEQECCGPEDCHKIEPPEITPEGYRIRETGEVIAFDRLLPTQDGK